MSSVIIKSLAGVQRRYEYDCNLSSPMMERLSHTQMSTCLHLHVRRVQIQKVYSYRLYSLMACAQTRDGLLCILPIFQSLLLVCTSKLSIDQIAQIEMFGFKGCGLYVKELEVPSCKQLMTLKCLPNADKKSVTQSHE